MSVKAADSLTAAVVVLIDSLTLSTITTGTAMQQSQLVSASRAMVDTICHCSLLPQSFTAFQIYNYLLELTRVIRLSVRPSVCFMVRIYLQFNKKKSQKLRTGRKVTVIILNFSCQSTPCTRTRRVSTTELHHVTCKTFHDVNKIRKRYYCASYHSYYLTINLFILLLVCNSTVLQQQQQQ